MNIPDYINTETLQGFIDMRKLIKKPLTDYALKLAIKKLIEFKEQGHDPNAILDQSIFNSWQGLFIIKEQNNGLQISGIGGARGRVIDFAAERQKQQDRNLAESLAKLAGYNPGTGRSEASTGQNINKPIAIGNRRLVEGLDQDTFEEAAQDR